MGEPLRSAPLVEALCEFRFTPSVNTSGWDMTLPGRLYERIREEFPNRSQVSEVGKNAVVSFEAQLVLEKGQEVIHCPTNVTNDTQTIVCQVRNDCTAYSENISSDCLVCINCAHGCVIGKKSKSFARALAKACKVEICPPFPDEQSIETSEDNLDG